MSATAYVGLGSNLGDRLKAMRAAVLMLQDHDQITIDLKTGVASLYETDPVGGPPGQGPFLNSAIRLATTLSSLGLLDVLLSIEDKLGRWQAERWGPRCIDLDLLLYDGLVVCGERLVLPHPRLHERRFVLEPLVEIAADQIHPVLNVGVVELARRAAEIGSDESAIVVAGGDWPRSENDPIRAGTVLS